MCEAENVRKMLSIRRVYWGFGYGLVNGGNVGVAGYPFAVRMVYPVGKFARTNLQNSVMLNFARQRARAL